MQMDLEERILIFTPTGRDAALVSRALASARVDAKVCESWTALESEYLVGAAAILLSEEALDAAGARRLHDFLSQQPSWSDLPVMLLIGQGSDTATMRAMSRTIGNVTLLERPMRVAALLSAVEFALRARRRQYEGRAQLLALERAADDLSASEHQLREAHARKDEFLATLAHELRNPLAPIRNALHVLRRKTPDVALAPLHDIVDRQLRNMVRLVDDLLEVSRITRGKVDLHLEYLDLASVLRSAIETSRPLIDAARHTLEVEMPPDGTRVHGDVVRLSQVFSNLLNNAAKYTEDGGHIAIRARLEGDEVEVIVEDDGIGIESGMLGSVFEMFTQVRGANARAQGGLGIGLTLVRSLVGLHAGRVTAHSEGPGQGSRFTVYLPAARRADLTDDSASLAPRTMACTGHVIIVDDNRDAADTLAMVLRQHGADVQTTYSAADVLDILVPHSRVAVIADLGMPELDGFELARRIRARDPDHDVQLIALSGWGQLEDRARAVEAGFDAHFTKPADIEALVALLSATTVGTRRRPPQPA
ncbi:MAG TPA: ATP-binding protein [Steroidobacteraceae bacterium]|nr:ATP-binding protein [Steroidobacteraceae bacterium]